MRSAQLKNLYIDTRLSKDDRVFFILYELYKGLTNDLHHIYLSLIFVNYTLNCDQGITD